MTASQRFSIDVGADGDFYVFDSKFELTNPRGYFSTASEKFYSTIGQWSRTSELQSRQYVHEALISYYARKNAA